MSVGVREAEFVNAGFGALGEVGHSAAEAGCRWLELVALGDQSFVLFGEALVAGVDVPGACWNLVSSGARTGTGRRAAAFCSVGYGLRSMRDSSTVSSSSSGTGSPR